MYKKHNLCSHPLYSIANAMHQRCYNKKRKGYKNYGGRGIKVCDEWLNDKEAFINWSLDNGWEKGLTIDRIDNDGDYEPDNCRFVTRQAQMYNTRLIQNHNKTGYRGVAYHKQTGRYQATFNINRKQKYLGIYKTAKKAALIRDAYNLARGSFLPFNFDCIQSGG